MVLFQPPIAKPRRKMVGDTARTLGTDGSAIGPNGCSIRLIRMIAITVTRGNPCLVIRVLLSA